MVISIEFPKHLVNYGKDSITIADWKVRYISGPKMHKERTFNKLDDNFWKKKNITKFNCSLIISFLLDLGMGFYALRSFFNSKFSTR